MATFEAQYDELLFLLEMDKNGDLKSREALSGQREMGQVSSTFSGSAPYIRPATSDQGSNATNGIPFTSLVICAPKQRHEFLYEAASGRIRLAETTEETPKWIGLSPLYQLPYSPSGQHHFAFKASAAPFTGSLFISCAVVSLAGPVPPDDIQARRFSLRRVDVAHFPNRRCSKNHNSNAVSPSRNFRSKRAP